MTTSRAIGQKRAGLNRPRELRSAAGNASAVDVRTLATDRHLTCGQPKRSQSLAKPPFRAATQGQKFCGAHQEPDGV